MGAAYLGLATIEGQLIEPIFFGRRLQLNPVIVFVALWLGGWLWGIAGILLALPVLVATKVAASQPGGNDVVLRFLGPAAHKPPEEPTAKGGEGRIEVPTLVPRDVSLDAHGAHLWFIEAKRRAADGRRLRRVGVYHFRESA